MEINVFSSSLTTKYPKWHSNLMNVLFTCMHIYTHAEAFSSNLKLNRKQLLFSRCPLESCTHILYVLYAAQKRKKSHIFPCHVTLLLLNDLKIDKSRNSLWSFLSCVRACVCTGIMFVLLLNTIFFWINAVLSPLNTFINLLKLALMKSEHFPSPLGFNKNNQSS